MALSDKQTDWLGSDEAEAVFKAAWYRRQRLGLEGKVKAGLEAVAEVLSEIHD